MWKYIFVICPDNSYDYQRVIRYAVFVDGNNNIIDVNGCDWRNGNAICKHCIVHYFSKLFNKPIFNITNYTYSSFAFSKFRYIMGEIQAAPQFVSPITYEGR